MIRIVSVGSSSGFQPFFWVHDSLNEAASGCYGFTVDVNYQTSSPQMFHFYIWGMFRVPNRWKYPDTALFSGHWHRPSSLCERLDWHFIIPPSLRLSLRRSVCLAGSVCVGLLSVQLFGIHTASYHDYRLHLSSSSSSSLSYLILRHFLTSHFSFHSPSSLTLINSVSLSSHAE